MDTSKFDHFDKQHFLKFSNPSLIEKDLQILIGILEGIRSDLSINNQEYIELANWIETRRLYENKSPYKEIIEQIREALFDEVLTLDEAQNIIWFCKQYVNKSGYYDIITSDIQKLTGIIQGISMDKELNIQELEYLDNWLENHAHLKNSYPYDELYSLCTQIIQDRHVSNDENNAFLAFVTALTGSTNTDSNVPLLESINSGFCQIDPDVTIQNRTFCITGISKKFKRREIAERIELFGGVVVDNVSAGVNYLVVCDEKNSCWAFTCYGRKIEQAIKHRKAGRPLVILHEFDLYDALENLS